ncbi:voltage-gated potassium channel [Aureococcus anophagefferens]|nr:voltage-gated potassium channel [Aureococcus anophagefferens]
MPDILYRLKASLAADENLDMTKLDGEDKDAIVEEMAARDHGEAETQAALQRLLLMEQKLDNHVMRMESALNDRLSAVEARVHGDAFAPAVDDEPAPARPRLATSGRAAPAAAPRAGRREAPPQAPRRALATERRAVAAARRPSRSSTRRRPSRGGRRAAAAPRSSPRRTSRRLERCARGQHANVLVRTADDGLHLARLAPVHDDDGVNVAFVLVVLVDVACALDTQVADD